MRVYVSGAVLGACLLAIPPAVGPDAEHRAVVLTAAADSIDLMSPIDALTSGGGGVDGVLSDELPDVGGLLSMAAGPAEADPFLTNLLAGAAIMFYFLVVVPVAVFLQTSWEWIAGVFGFDSYPDPAEALGTDLPGINAAGVIDPAVSTDLIGDLNPALDTSAVADPGVVFGEAGVEAGIADIGALLSSLIS